ncbi:PI-PLC X domain-containing protein 3, partial [Stegodyphus mimosarum]
MNSMAAWNKTFLLPAFLFLQLSVFSNGVSFGRIFKRETEGHETNANGVKPLVFLTVSSLASRTRSEEARMLELNWDHIPQNLSENGDVWIGLYNRDPVDDTSNPLVSTRPNPEGYFRTSIRFPVQTFKVDSLTDTCLGFWIALIRNSEILASNCIRARPNWMFQAQSLIGNAALIDLMIPGTHNAGCYADFNPKEDTLVNRYLLTQEETIWDQLVYGIRYLDLRVAYYRSKSSPERFWITHSNFRTEVPVTEVINQVKQFLNATNEIVIMDFHRFVTGFQGSRATARHRELVQMLENELGDYMIPIHFTSWATLNQLWTEDKRLYVGYADETSRKQSFLLFPAVRHLWGDVDTVNGLKAYLNETVCSQTARRLTSAMAQLTPTTAGALFDIYGGLRRMANDVNHHVTRWFRDSWNHCANIVSTDFFLGNNMIEVAIETNKNRFSSV